MMKEKILFMGTPPIARTMLERLVSEGYEIVGVLTQPDRRVGRMPAGVGQSLLDGAVGDLAEGIVQLAELLDVDPGIHAHAGLPRVGDECVERFPGEGCVVGRGQLDIRLIGMPEHVDDCVGLI